MAPSGKLGSEGQTKLFHWLHFSAFLIFALKPVGRSSNPPEKPRESSLVRAQAGRCDRCHPIINQSISISCVLSHVHRGGAAVHGGLLRRREEARRQRRRLLVPAAHLRVQHLQVSRRPVQHQHRLAPPLVLWGSSGPEGPSSRDREPPKVPTLYL